MKNKRVMTKEEIKVSNLDLNDLPTLDSFKLSKDNFKLGLFKAIFFSILSFFIFFVPISINGKKDIVFGVIYNFFMRVTGDYGLWMVTIIITLNALFSFIGKFFLKKGKIFRYYSGDSALHPFLYLIGAVYVLMYSIAHSFKINMPEIIIGAKTGQSIIPTTVVAVFWIIIVGAFTMPFLLNYGVVDFIGSFMEPLMRPIWKVPGRAAVNAIASFVSSSSVGVLITNKLYRMGVYTEKEAVLAVTGFSAVSVGFAYMVIQTAGLEDYFIKIYLSSLLLTMIVSAIVARFSPLSRKKDVYLNGHEQTDQQRKVLKHEEGVFKIAIERAAKKGYTAEPLIQEIRESLKDGLLVLPKVISLLSCVGVSALILAENTPIFTWAGKIFEPLLYVLRVPNVSEIAPSFPVGIAEMFLPVLLIKNNISQIAAQARYIVVAVSIVQILFFSETIVVITASKMPIKIKEIIAVFFERTVVAIILASIMSKLMF